MTVQSLALPKAWQKIVVLNKEQGRQPMDPFIIGVLPFFATGLNRLPCSPARGLAKIASVLKDTQCTIHALASVCQCAYIGCCSDENLLLLVEGSYCFSNVYGEGDLPTV